MSNPNDRSDSGSDVAWTYPGYVFGGFIIFGVTANALGIGVAIAIFLGGALAIAGLAYGLHRLSEYLSQPKTEPKTANPLPESTLGDRRELAATNTYNHVNNVLEEVAPTTVISQPSAPVTTATIAPVTNPSQPTAPLSRIFSFLASWFNATPATNQGVVNDSNNSNTLGR